MVEAAIAENMEHTPFLYPTFLFLLSLFSPQGFETSVRIVFQCWLIYKKKKNCLVPPCVVFASF